MSWIFGGCKILMAVTNYPMDIGTAVGRSGKMYKIFRVAEALARFVGKYEISFFTAIEIVKKYIDDHNLLNPENTEEVLCDDKLKTIFDGKDKIVGLIEMVELLTQHFPFRTKMLANLAATNDSRTDLLNMVVEVSEPLASFLSESKVSRATAMGKVWIYIDAHELWENDFSLLRFFWITKKSERWIRCDDKLKTIFDGKNKVAMSEFVPLLMRHFPDHKLNN